MIKNVCDKNLTQKMVVGKKIYLGQPAKNIEGTFDYFNVIGTIGSIIGTIWSIIVTIGSSAE